MNNNDGNPTAAQGHGPQLVDSAPKRTRKTVEAYNIAEPVRDLIAAEFRVLKSSRRLAQKYKLPQHVISDILHLALRKQPQSERLVVMPRRATA